MTKEFKWCCLFLLCFFLLGLGGLTILYRSSKEMIIHNNEVMAGVIINRYPEAEEELVIALQKTKDHQIDNSVLTKYGLTSMISLDYLDSMQEYRRVFFGGYFLFFGLLFLVISSYFYLVQRKRKKEIQKIDEYLYALLSTEIKVDLKDFQNGELATLQNDLMKVTSRLKNSLDSSTKDKQELAKSLADISHQLKTPLTSLSILNEALANFSIDEETRKEFLSKQADTLEHMKGLIIILLKVSQIESGMIELKKEEVSLVSLVNHVYEQLELIMISKNIKVEQNIQDVTITGDFSWLCEAISNILKNAYEHSYMNGKVLIAVKENPLYIEITIEDEGKGIVKKDIPHIFDRFYKSSPHKESIGIGLSLTKSILDRSNATINVESIPGHTKFIIHFYRNSI